MGQSIANWFISTFGAELGKIIGTFVISMLPIIELRGAIPVAFILNLDWVTTFLVVVIGNLLPIPFILFFLDYVFDFMVKHNIFGNVVTKMQEKAQAKSGRVMKYEFWGLALFVGIPLPGTGAWTGALVASVMKMDKKKAMISITVGVLGAAVLVTALTYGVLGLVF